MTESGVTTTTTIEPDGAPPPAAGSPVGHSGIRVDVRERRAIATSGFLGLLVAFVLAAATVVSFNRLAATSNGPWAVLGAVLGAATVIVAVSLAVIQPGRTAVVQFFGRYIGTARTTGLVWLP